MGGMSHNDKAEVRNCFPHDELPIQFSARIPPLLSPHLTHISEAFKKERYFGLRPILQTPPTHLTRLSSVWIVFELCLGSVLRVCGYCLDNRCVVFGLFFDSV